MLLLSKHINKITGNRLTLIALFIMFSVNYASAQLVVSTAMTPQQLVQNVLVGSGITVSNVKYTGSLDAIGRFSGGGGSNIGMANGIIMANGMVDGTGTNGNCPCQIGSPASNFNTWNMGTPGDSLLSTIASKPLDSCYDAAVLNFDFIPLSDTIRFQYVFASEEYPEYVNSIFNDVFGFFISGQNPSGGNYIDKNIALIPGTTTPVSINNVNNGNGSQTGPCKNCAYYVNNSNGQTIVYNGFTTVLTAICDVIPCTTYHIEIAVEDVGDANNDSAVFLEANSFSSDALKTSVTYTSSLDTMAIEGCSSAIVSFILQNPATSPYVINYTIGGTATNGVDYPLIPSSDTIPAGQDSVGIKISPIIGGLPDSVKTVTITIQTSVCGNPQVYTVYIKRNSQLIAQTSGDTTICGGGQLTLHSFGLGGTQPYSYLWSNGAGDTSTVIVSPTISTNYFITITDACGAIVTDSVMVNFATTNAVIGNDTTICSGGTATLTAGGGIAYHWSNNVNSNINPVSPLQTTVYYVTVTDACKGYDSITVNVNPPPTIITSASPDSICVGGSSTLNATGGVSYVWSSNPVDSGLIGQQTLSDPVVHPTITTIYTVIGTDNLTCTNTSSVVVVIKPTPIASFTINPQEACVGQTVTLLYNGTVGSKISYNWDFGGGFLVGPNYQFYWDSTGKKIITLSIIVDGCPSTTFIDSVLIDPLPVAGFTATDTAGCAPLTVSFIDSSKYESASTIYLWNFGDGSTSTEQDPIHGYNNAGTYNVTLTISNGAGCTDSLTLLKFVHVYPAPVAAFAANPYTVSIFDPAVMFFNKSTGYPPPVSWLWNMGDGGISADSSNFIYTYRDTGKFEVSLIAYNKYGCSDTTFANITVRSDYSIYIPNAFTPNGDALNPVFYAYGTGITVFDMKIFDRWGELLFESNDIYAGWDGKYKGAPCPEGVYTYQIYYIEDQKEEHLLFGRITLIR